MSITNSEIFLSFKQSMDSYEKDQKSDHWKKNYKKKLGLFNEKYLTNFRNNNFSDGLDVKLYDVNHQRQLLKSLIEECGEEFVKNNLCKQNIGNLKSTENFKGKFLDNNQFYSIKWLNLLINKIKIENQNIICEIGGGYGCFAEKLIKYYNCKYILIDLPEANILSTYYLSKHFPDKKIFIYNKNMKFVDSNLINEFDIIIVPPWVKLDGVKIDLFINTRSFMEMNFDVIKSYFNLIEKNLKLNGYFFNNNRYLKDTVGYPILFYKYPYDKKWKVEYSKKSWFENHCHTLITKRISTDGDIYSEIENIKVITNLHTYKFDKYLIKRLLPSSIFNLLIKIKNKFF